MNQELIPNLKLSHYRIVSKIGAGGMGEVYRALDTRLDREVAIKVLPADFANDPDRLKRFEQEARATSALNHPNILTVYDIGTHEGAPFIVAELLDGEELRAQLEEGAIAPKKVIEYARQIADGLAAAHEKGIVHRDLKPENLFITKDGRVKILDFGLAKLKPQKLTGGVDSEGETMKPLTNPGVVMGTVGYMSPEQVRGETVDHRSDLFSFGLILFEMLCGERAFHRETMAETMTAILKEDPPELSETNDKISPQLEKIVRRCLEKKPERRFHSAHDLGFALESLSASSTTSGKNLTTHVSAITEETVKPKRANLPMLLGGLVLLTLGVLAGIFAYGYFRQAPMPKYEQLTFRRGLITHARFSPDGQTIIYSAEWGGKPGEIFTTRGGIGQSRSLDLKDADVLSVSSTGELAILIKRQYLGQLTHKGTLARVPILGGTPREILEDVQEADWSPDGKELAVVRSVGGKIGSNSRSAKCFLRNGRIHQPSADFA
ncbi:MAG: protein kinase [Acidobacteria bacterium]|nr:protein kinase [Acidobacteriota bacterium]